MAEERKIALQVEVDGSGVKPGIDDIKGQLDGLGKQAQRTGGELSKPFDDLPKRVKPAADSIDSTTRSIIGSIQRTTAAQKAGEKGSAAYYEALAGQRGVNTDILRPYLDQLRQAEAAQKAAVGGLGNMEMSAKATANALRGVPAQFTDIVTSLQGGQKPLTVFLQQGGQLKDMFGGAGNAAKALGGYVTGLINPFTVAAAVAGTLAVAYYQGSKEAENYNKALILSGNIAGTTAGQMADMARQLGQGDYTQGKAASVIAELAQSGAVAAEQLQKFAGIAIDVERATGQAIGKTAEVFKDLEKAPLEATLKLNDSLHYLTLSTYEQIKALTEQGRMTDAAKLAMSSYADTMASRAKQITENNGFLETSWRGVGKAAAWAWDQMAGIGRAATGSEQLASQKTLLSQLEKRAENAAPWEKGEINIRLNKTREQIALTERLNEAQQQSAKFDADRQRAQEKGIASIEAVAKAQAKGLSKQEQMNAALSAYNKQIADIRSADPNSALLDPKKVAEGAAAIREEYKERAKGSSAAATAAKRELSEYDKLIASIKTKILQNEAEVAGNAKLSESEKLRLSLVAQMEQGTRKMTAAHLASAQAQLKQLDASEQAKAVYLAQQKFEVEREKEAVSRNNEILKINETAQALEDEAAAYGLGKQALEAMRAERRDEKKTIISFFDNPERVIKELDEAGKAAKRLAEAQDLITGKKFGSQADELLRNAKEQAKLYEDEFRLSGLTALERAKVVAHRQVELKYAKKLAELNELKDSPEKEAARVTLNEAKMIETSGAVNKVIKEDFAKTSEQINQSLTDALMRGFESGKDFASNLRDTLVNMFKTTILRPTISAIMAPVSGAVNSVMGGITGGGSGGMGMLSSLGSIASGTGILGAGGLGLQSGFGALINSGLSGIGAAVSGGLSAIGAGTGASIAAGLGTIAGALGPIGLGIAGAMMLMPKGDKRFGSSYRYDAENDSRINGKEYVNGGQVYSTSGVQGSADKNGVRIIGGPNGGVDFDGKSAAQATVIDSINALYKRLGSQTSLAAFQSGFESSEKGKGFAYAGGVTNKGDVFGQGANGGGHLNRRGSMTNEQAMEAYALELKQATLQALQSATDIPKSIASMLADTDIEALSTQALDQLSAAIDKQIMDVTGLREALSALPMANLKDLSFDAASGLIAAAGGLEQLSSGLSSYYDNFYSESEKTANSTRLITEALTAVNIAMPKTRDEFRAQVEAAIALGEAGAPALAALLGVNAAFAGITPVVTAVGADLKTAFESIGGMSSELSKIIMDGINNSDPAGAGQFFADTLIYGVQNALYQGFADQVTSIITDQLVSPMVTALATGASISEAISGAAIESMVAQANAAAAALNAILSDSSFQDALKQISSAVSGAVSGSIGLVQKPAYSAPSYRGGSSYSGGGGGGGGGTQDPWKSAADAIVNAIKDLKSSLLETGPDSFVRLQAQYAIDVAKAKSGDLTAAENLPGLAKSVANAAKDYGQTSAEQAMLIGSLIESMSDVVKSRGFAVPGFASGGMHSGGLRLVGERGWEVEATGPARIWNQQQIAGAMGGGNNNAELVTEIRALREEVASLRYSSEATASATRQTAKTLDSAANGGQPLTTLAVS